MAVASYMNAPKIKQQKQAMVAPSSGGVRPTAQLQTMDMPQAQRMPTPMPTNPGPQQPSTAGGWQLPAWNPATTSPAPPTSGRMTTGANQGQQAVQWGGERSFFEGDPNIFLSDAYKSNDGQTPNYISSVLPVAQFAQNNAQYRNDFNEAQRRWNQEFGLTQGQNQFQQSLSTRQQQAAEMQAQLAAQQWAQQFGHTQYMDTQGLDLSRQQIGNTYAMGMDQNQASRDVANIYGNANINQAHIAAGTDRYVADQQMRADLYGADRTTDVATIYGGAQRYNTDAQERMNQLMMQNNLQLANINAYGRSAAPNAQWARGWA